MVLTYDIILTSDAIRDLRQILKYYVELDLTYSGEKIVSDIHRKINSLNVFPEMGEVSSIINGVSIRKVHQKRYIIYYFVDNKQRKVYVVAIADARRGHRPY